MTTTDPTPLQERIARALAKADTRIAAGFWDRHLAAAVLPIITAEVRKAQADAWDEGAYAGYDDGKYDGDTPNPYREQED